MKIGLIPLDERPVNTRYPKMIGTIAGVDVLLPPPESWSQFRTPADCGATAAWLREIGSELDVLIVSIEMLCYGGLLPSRITDDSIHTLIERLSILREIKIQNPGLAIYGFNLIMRISKNPHSVEEPAYWSQSGPQLYQYSQAYDRHRRADGQQPATDHIANAHLQDFLWRRLRNHTLNLIVLDLLADDIFDLLVISSDDTSEYGFGTREKQWLSEWVERRGGDARLRMYPGADEVGTVLLARAIMQAQKMTPRFYAHYAIEADKDRVAPFEDGPVSLTLERQLRAVGGEQRDSISDADMIIAVNPPAPGGKDFFDPQDAANERAYRAAPLQQFAQQIRAWLAENRTVILCDVAYPNGSDPVLIEALREHMDLSQLAAYGAWNTAGNTIGVALAQGIANHIAKNPVAQQQLLLHRFIEDYAYQHLVRQQVASITEDTLLDDETVTILCERIQAGLSAQLAKLNDFAGWRIQNVRLPWRRLFEVDFDLEHT